jgi:cobalt-zinc-cadmium efflux system membrane fusion protein
MHEHTCPSRRKTRRHATILLATALAACLAAPTSRAADKHGHDRGGHADEVKLTPDAIRANGIRVETAKAQVLTATIAAPARLAYNAEAMAHAGAIVPGRIKELKVRVGDAVKQGHVLAIVDSPEFGQAQSDFLQRRTSIESAKPAVELAREAYERARKLYDSTQGITLTEVQSRQRELQAAQAEVRNAETALAAARNRLALLGMNDAAIATLAEDGQIDPTYAIRAAIEGRVIERGVTLGELVGPDKDHVMRIANLDNVWALADVPEAKLGEVAEGAAATVTLPGLGGASVDGKVAYVAPELDATTRTARVRIVLPNAERKLRPGMFGRAEIAGAAAGGEPVVAVPEAAVLNVEGEPSVFVPVEGEPNTFARRAVGAGAPIDGKVPIFAGLSTGEKYVAAGAFILKAELGKAGAAHEH